MALDSTSIQVDSKELQAFLKRSEGLKDVTRLLNAIADLELSQTKQRFVKQIDPAGNPWKPTQRQKKNPSAKILRKTGNLFNSLTKKIIGQSAFIGTNVSYGLFHQTGDSSRGLPKRQFVGTNAKTFKNIDLAIKTFINKGILK